MSRANLLFLTPTLPYTTGTGSAIRAGATLAALAKHFEVYVMHAEMWGWHQASFKTDFVKQMAASYVYYVPQNGELPMHELVSKHFGGLRFQAIHAFRLIMAPAALAVLLRCDKTRPLAVIDLDDDEYRRAEQFLDLRVQNGDRGQALVERKELPRLQGMERVLVPRFQAICLAAQEDCERVKRRYPAATVAHLPNAVFRPSVLPTENGSSEHPPTLLFVGTLDYLPNEDGVRFFCSQILPVVRRSYSGPLRVRLVGAHPTAKVQELTRYAEVEVVANVPDLAPYYAEADVVIVPLRVGSGTRIKILEAFSYRRPVVSTTMGAEGLKVENGQQLIIADGPETFANACIRLLESAALRETLAESACAWVAAHHSISRVEDALLSVYAPGLQRS